MTMLVLGLVLMLGVHSVRVFAAPWRDAMVLRMGAGGWKAAYSVVSVAGLALVVAGYGAARGGSPELWGPPVWTRHLASLLTLAAFVLLAAAYVPRNRIKAAIGHPMVAGVKLWAFAHLIANGRLSDVVLFGAFLAWAVVAFRAARARDRAAGTRYPAGGIVRDALTLVVGLVAWLLFALVLHAPLIGVRPF